ncbi:MAG TPA: hypothetical protein PLV85_11930, partial [Polyangiaceae bacterium]|nr:hypothetical protein [Polyangiaceae bacterium]
AAVSTLWRKCKTRANDGQFSNTDNMAVVGVLSTQVLHHTFVRSNPKPESIVEFNTLIDRLSPHR